MDTMVQIRPTTKRERCFSLPAGPAAACAARGLVRAAVESWDVPVDYEVAALLTSELVTNAIRHEAGQTVTLVITLACGYFGVDVHDTSSCVPVPVDGPADAETGRGLMLVDSLSTDWGFYWTPSGKAVYFTLVFEPGLDEGDDFQTGPHEGSDRSLRNGHIRVR
jgi:anti-sigma regulatory factor (Ser/Thr protein kinase)